VALEIWACVLDGVVGKFRFPTVQCFYASHSHSILGEGHIVIKRVVTSLAGW